MNGNENDRQAIRRWSAGHMLRPTGIEPASKASEAYVLSVRLRAQGSGGISPERQVFGNLFTESYSSTACA